MAWVGPSRQGVDVGNGRIGRTGVRRGRLPLVNRKKTKQQTSQTRSCGVPVSGRG